MAFTAALRKGGCRGEACGVSAHTAFRGAPSRTRLLGHIRRRGFVERRIGRDVDAGARQRSYSGAQQLCSVALVAAQRDDHLRGVMREWRVLADETAQRAPPRVGLHLRWTCDAQHACLRKRAGVATPRGSGAFRARATQRQQTPEGRAFVGFFDAKLHQR